MTRTVTDITTLASPIRVDRPACPAGAGRTVGVGTPAWVTQLEVSMRKPGSDAARRVFNHPYVLALGGA